MQDRYRKAHGGRNAPVDPIVREEWEDMEKHCNWSLFNDTALQAEAFGDVFNSQVLGSDEVSCSKSMSVPFVSGEARRSFFQPAVRYLDGRRATLPRG